MQTPLISIPRKSTEEVDWSTPLRHHIAQIYSESPDTYTSELSQLSRCRQDAVRGAGSDFTARDLLYKYFGQLELLELRFSEVRVGFPWCDAFVGKVTTQSSLAYEKASILFLIAATHSAIAASAPRASNPEGLKRAYHYTRTAAGMLTYINENFLHAPSLDLSREVVKFLIGIMMAQATEVFWEKCVEEKKSEMLISRVAADVSGRYASLSEEVKEFMGKGIFDRNWVLLIQVKAKYFASLTQYHRSLADETNSKHGEALARLIQSESLAKEATKLASSFSSSFIPLPTPSPSSPTTSQPTLPPDAGTSMVERTKSHHAIVLEKKTSYEKANDLIYNALVPNFDTLPVVERASVASPIHIHEVYATPEVQKTIGSDIFGRLVPLSVHESASVYSEEKAKVVRSEVEKVDLADVELKSGLEAMGVKDGMGRYREMVREEEEDEEEGGGGGVPREVKRWREDLRMMESKESIDSLLGLLEKRKGEVKNRLGDLQTRLDEEARECEVGRVEWGHLWDQVPSGGYTKEMRSEMKAHWGALEVADQSDAKVVAIWESVRREVGILLSDALPSLFQEPPNLLDSSPDEEDDAEKLKIRGLIGQVDELMERLSLIGKERKQVLKDLKEKIQNDDVSHLLLLNRRNTNVEPTLFKTELEKFKPLSQRLDSTIRHQTLALSELGTAYKALVSFARHSKLGKRKGEKAKLADGLKKRFEDAQRGYGEARGGAERGLEFYKDLGEVVARLAEGVEGYLREREKERRGLKSRLEMEKRLGAMSLGGSGAGGGVSGPPPPPPPRPGHAHTPSQSQGYPPPPQTHTPSQSYPPPPPQQMQSHRQTPSQSFGLPPPPPPQMQTHTHTHTPSQSQSQGYSDPYSALSMFDSLASPPPPPPQQQQSYSSQSPHGNMYASAPPPPPSAGYASSPSSAYPPPPPSSSGYPPSSGGYSSGPSSGYASAPPPPLPQSQSQQRVYGLPPPPPPIRQGSLGYYAQGQGQPQGQGQGFAQGQPQGQGQGWGSTISPPPPPPPQQQYGYGNPNAGQQQQGQGQQQGYYGQGQGQGQGQGGYYGR